MESLQVWQHRRPLTNTRKAIAKGSLTVGFIGGSITDERPGHNWPEAVLAWLVEQFPGVRIMVENAAIGATGSDLAVFRVQRDIVRHNCDLVFVEHAVNDSGMPSERRYRTREGVLRKILETGKTDVIAVYTFAQDMYDDMMNHRVPASISEFEELARHYDIASVWMGLYALDEVKRGRMKWEEWLPDGLHPTHRGSLSYAESVIQLLAKELKHVEISNDAATQVPYELPQPFTTKHWGAAEVLPFDAVELEGPWTIRRSTRNTWLDQVLETSAVGAKLHFRFTGNVLALTFDFGKASCEFNYRLDGGDVVSVVRDRPDWCGDSGWLRMELIAEDLQGGSHEIEIEVTHGNAANCRGTHFSLGIIGVVQYM